MVPRTQSDAYGRFAGEAKDDSLGEQAGASREDFIVDLKDRSPCEGQFHLYDVILCVYVFYVRSDTKNAISLQAMLSTLRAVLVHLVLGFTLNTPSRKAGACL